MRPLSCSRTSWLIALSLAGGSSLAATARAVTLFTPDKFSDGTVQEWLGGTTITNAAGGPTGPDDRFLTVATNATAGPGSRLAAHNAELRWSGDFLAAGVNGVEVDLRNLGATPLVMRLVVFGGGNRWTSATGVSLPVGSGWQHITFPINQSALTRVLGSGAYTDSMMAVTQVMFRHDTDPPSSGGASIVGTVGIDNPMAVPTPGALALLGPAAVLALRRRRA